MSSSQSTSKESDPLLYNPLPSIKNGSSFNEYNDVEKGESSFSSNLTTPTDTPSLSPLPPTKNVSSRSNDASSSSCISFSTQVQGRLTLVFVAFLYGTLNVSLRMLYALPNPPSASVLSTVRGWLAAAAFIPLSKRVHREISSGYNNLTGISLRKLYLAAFELAVWNFGAQGLLNVGLLFTDAARAAFFTQTSVVMTPLLSFSTGGSVGKSVWMGCFVALTGLVLLSSSSHGDGSNDDKVESSTAATSIASSSWFYLSPGDFIVLGGAASWSMYIFRVSSLSQKHPEVTLQAFKTIFLACLYTTWYISSAAIQYNSHDVDDDGSSKWSSVLDLWRGYDNWIAWLILLYSAVGPGTVADILQQSGQKFVSASEANVILCGEPVFTSILSIFVLGEFTSMTEYFGGALIVFAAILASR